MYIGSRKQGIKWGTKLCEKLIKTIHLLWKKRNSFEHDRKIHGLKEVEDIQLKTAIRGKYKLGTARLKKSDKYLFKSVLLLLRDAQYYK